jgi:hypothetical protein
MHKLADSLKEHFEEFARLTTDADRRGAMQQPVEDRTRKSVVADELAPITEALLMVKMIEPRS